jgi:hypothetical protein
MAEHTKIPTVECVPGQDALRADNDAFEATNCRRTKRRNCSV